MKRILVILLAAILVASCSKENCQIRYSSDVKIELKNIEGFGAKIESHEFENGLGVITFNKPIITIPNEAFNECRSLRSITIPNSITSIGNFAFSGCFSLKSISIPDSVTSIGNGTFLF